MTKNFTCFYFSGTGNTMLAAQMLCASLTKLGFDAKAISIEGISAGEAAGLANEAAILGLAWPIYGSDMPSIMKSFIKALPSTDGKPLLTMCTQLFFSGDGAYVMHHALKAKGYRHMWCRQILMPNNLYVPGLPLYPHADYNKHEKRHLGKASVKIGKLAQQVASGKRAMPGSDPLCRALGFLLQRYWYEKFIHKQAQQWTGVDKSRCSSCGLCQSICPGGVIKLDNGYPEFCREKCIVCMRCYNFCPARAITISGKPYNGNRPQSYKGPTREIFRKMIGMDLQNEPDGHQQQ